MSVQYSKIALNVNQMLLMSTKDNAIRAPALMQGAKPVRIKIYALVAFLMPFICLMMYVVSVIRHWTIAKLVQIKHIAFLATQTIIFQAKVAVSCATLRWRAV